MFTHIHSVTTDLAASSTQTFLLVDPVQQSLHSGHADRFA